jgi:hypothetical protein
VNKLAVYSDDGAIFELIADTSLPKSVIKFGDSGIRFNFNPELLFFQIMKTTDELVNHAERQLYYI